MRCFSPEQFCRPLLPLVFMDLLTKVLPVSLPEDNIKNNSFKSMTKEHLSFLKSP